MTELCHIFQNDPNVSQFSEQNKNAILELSKQLISLRLMV